MCVVRLWESVVAWWLGFHQMVFFLLTLHSSSAGHSQASATNGSTLPAAAWGALAGAESLGVGAQVPVYDRASNIQTM